MKDYQVKLIAEGTITQIPDSQKVFGALVYLFSERYGSKEATRLTRAILNKEIHFMLSNVIPSGYIPTPQDYLIQETFKKRKTNLKKQYSFIKERCYITENSLKQTLSDSLELEDIYPYISVNIRQQLRTSIDSIRYNIPELENKLYSIPIMAISEINRSKNNEISSTPVSRFSFYFQIDDSELAKNLLELLNQAVLDKGSIVLGKRASQGMNLFQFDKIVNCKSENGKSDLYLNMGMLLPDNIDMGVSTLKLFTSERRPFEMQGGWEKNLEKQYISFIAEGSILTLKGSVKDAGKSIKSPFNKARDIVFGNAYMYPLLVERVV